MTFEEAFPVIEREVNKRRARWKLNAVRWMDFEDVKWIIINHISQKWHLYDQTRKLENWVSTVASRRIINLLRDNYTNYARPCIKCPHSIDGDMCEITPSGNQCSECPMYKEWANKKKIGHDIKLPLELELHAQEVFERVDEGINFDFSVEKIKTVLSKNLSPEKFQAFCWLFIEKKSDMEVAEMMGYKTHLRCKSICNKQIKDLKDELFVEVKKIIKEHDIL